VSTNFIGEIRMFAGNFGPAGWMLCEGQLLPISEYETLFNLIGTTYGGDGQSTFALPDLRSRIPVHAGTSGGSTFQLASTGGVETVTLTTQQIPAHTHAMLASTAPGTQNSPAGNVTAASPSVTLYTADATDSNMAGAAVSTVGGNQPHNNLQPFLCVNFIISLFGIFPSPT
jgi:microcystin-dependent protein